MKEQPSWIGWSKNKNAVSPLPLRQLRVSGVVWQNNFLHIVLILLIRQATLILQLKLNVRYVFWTVLVFYLTRSAVLNHSLKPFGVKQINMACHVWPLLTKWIERVLILHAL